MENFDKILDPRADQVPEIIVSAGELAGKDVHTDGEYLNEATLMVALLRKALNVNGISAEQRNKIEPLIAYFNDVLQTEDEQKGTEAVHFQ